MARVSVSLINRLAKLEAKRGRPDKPIALYGPTYDSDLEWESVAILQQRELTNWAWENHSKVIRN